MSVTNESLPTAKWIFSYRRESTRKLSDEERSAHAATGLQLRWSAIGLAVLSVVVFFGAFLCLAVAAGGHPLWWAGFVGGLVGFFWVLSLSTRQDSLGYLYRRAARLGVVDRYVPAVRPEGFEPIFLRPRGDEGDDEVFFQRQWLDDEKFEERLARIVGQRPAWFETPAGDPVILSVEGRLVKSVLNGYAAFFRN